MISVGGNAEVSVSVWLATSFGTAFSRAANGVSRPGQILANSSQVFRPNSMTPWSSTLPSWNLSPATVSGPCRNAQPPAGVPSDPSGSDTIPSRVMNSITITLMMSLPWWMHRGRCTPVHTGGTGPAHRAGRKSPGGRRSGRPKTRNTSGSANTTLTATWPPAMVKTCSVCSQDGPSGAGA